MNEELIKQIDHMRGESRMSTPIILEEGDEQPCLQCNARTLDTGWECNTCGYDNRPWYYPEGARNAAVLDKGLGND